jgi:perosamine synthetase
MRINWNEPRFDDDDLKEVSQVLKDSYVNEGPKTKELEQKLKDYLDVKHVILTANATAALFLAVKADAIIKGKKEFEVIIPDMTMFATATAVEWAGGKPILVDVEKDRMTLDTEKLENKITSKTTAIIPVHILGRSADMEKLNQLARKNNLTIIEDAAGALGSKNADGKYLGTIGKVGCFSLQSNKIITSGQGGIIVTDDDKYNEVIRRLRDFGRFDKEFLHNTIGYNLKFNDLSAALALSQFKKLEERRRLLIQQREQYKKELSGLENIKFPKFQESEIPLWIDIIAENRDEIFDYLKSFEIYSRKCWPAIHENPPYQNQGTDEDFPNSSFISKSCIWLPNGPAIDSEKIKFICSKIKDFFSKKKFKKVHEDERGGLYIVENLPELGKEFNFMEMKKGAARGGCYHDTDEYFVVIKGKVNFIHGPFGGPFQEKILTQGESGITRAGVSHSFIALEDSIVSEWGITTEEKMANKKDTQLRNFVDEANRRLSNP